MESCGRPPALTLAGENVSNHDFHWVFYPSHTILQSGCTCDKLPWSDPQLASPRNFRVDRPIILRTPSEEKSKLEIGERCSSNLR